MLQTDKHFIKMLDKIRKGLVDELSEKNTDIKIY